MRQVSLREFRTRGAKALGAVPRGETVLLAGRRGPAYFLVPVFGDLAAEEKELRRAMAKASLRRGWSRAEASGLNETSDEEINREIIRLRIARKPGKARRSKGKSSPAGR
jgi:antitoxin (DNA-binding transcriptional repressor) of toxin-antitoxin stability system